MTSRVNEDATNCTCALAETLPPRRLEACIHPMHALSLPSLKSLPGASCGRRRRPALRCSSQQVHTVHSLQTLCAKTLGQNSGASQPPQSLEQLTDNLKTGGTLLANRQLLSCNKAESLSKPLVLSTAKH